MEMDRFQMVMHRLRERSRGVTRLGGAVVAVVVLWSLVLPAVAQAAGESSGVVIYPVEYDVEENGMVSGTVNGKDLPFEYQHTFSDTYTPERDHKGNYARFAADGPVNIELTVQAEVTEAALHALRSKLPFQRDGSEFRFTLPGPGHYLLTLPDLYIAHNQTYAIHFFVDSLTTYNRYQEEFASAVNVTDEYSVTSDAEEDQTAHIQQALNSEEALYFPKGIYRSAPLEIPSNTTVLLDAGAVLKGTDDYNRSPFLHVDGSDSVRIAGLGTIDVNALTEINRNTKVHGIDWENDCHYQRVEDLVFRDSKSWMLHVMQSKDVYFNNLKLFSGKDGVDPDGVTDMVVENSTIVSIDDGFAVKSRQEGYSTRNVLMRDSFVMSSASNMKIGTENYYGVIENITWDNIKVINGDRGAILYTNEDGTGDIRNVTWQNIHIENFAWDNRGEGSPFQIRHETGDPNDYTMHNILFENIRVWPETDGVIKEPVSATFNNIIVNGRSCMPPSKNITYQGVIWECTEGSHIPVVFIAPSPRAHSRYVNGDEIVIDVQHPTGKPIAKVEVFIDGVSIGTDREAPYAVELDGISLGDHVAEATAVDVDGVTNSTAPLRIKVVDTTKYYNSQIE